MNMRLKDIELKREAMEARMDVIKMRIDLKKSDPTLSKDEIDILLHLPQSLEFKLLVSYLYLLIYN